MSVYHPLSVNASIPRHRIIYSEIGSGCCWCFIRDEAVVVLRHPSFLTPYPSRAVRHAEERAQGLGPRALRSDCHAFADGLGDIVDILRIFFRNDHGVNSTALCGQRLLP